MTATVAIVEDNIEVAEELAKIVAAAPDCQCVAICRNLRTALRNIPPLRPDVVIMDINLPDGSGITGTAELKRLLPETQILIFTIYEDHDQIIKSLAAGASGYLLKRTASDEMVRAIREIKSGGVPMTPEVARKVIQTFHRKPPQAPPSDPLTRREEEILQLLCQGKLSKEIARDLAITIDTVNTHLKHIYIKLNVSTRTQAVLKVRS